MFYLNLLRPLAIGFSPSLYLELSFFAHSRSFLEMTLPVQLLIPVAIQLLSLDLFQSRTPEIIQTTLKNVINNQTSNGQYETCEPPVTLICPSHSSCYQVPQESCGAIDGFCRTLLINMCLERITAPTFEREVCSIIYTKLLLSSFLYFNHLKGYHCQLLHGQ